jgi:hypothetical protein
VPLVYLQHVGAIANIGHNGHSAEAGDKFAKKFDSLASSVGRLLRQARNIAARSREVRDETSTNWIVRWRENDRDGRCRLLCRVGRSS